METSPFSFWIGLGVLLILGLCTRPAAFLGAVMLIGFYVVLPPCQDRFLRPRVFR